MEQVFQAPDCVWRQALLAATKGDLPHAPEGVISLGAVFRLDLTVDEGRHASTKHAYPLRSNFLRSRVDAWIDRVSLARSAYETLRANANGENENAPKKRLQALGAELKHAQEDLTAFFDECEACLIVGTYLASEHASCADYLVFALAHGLARSKICGKDLLEKRPGLCRWLSTISASGCKH